MKIGEMKDYREPKITARTGLNVGDIVRNPIVGTKCLLVNIGKDHYVAICLEGNRKARKWGPSAKFRANGFFTSSQLEQLLGTSWRDWRVVDE